jgi:hypothetical protein
MHMTVCVLNTCARLCLLGSTPLGVHFVALLNGQSEIGGADVHLGDVQCREVMVARRRNRPDLDEPRRASVPGEALESLMRMQIPFPFPLKYDFIE